MDQGPSLKPKVTVKLAYASTSRPPSRNNTTRIPSRPTSPTKPYVSTAKPNPVPSPAFRPKAKVNSSANIRKAGTSSTVSANASPTPRAGSPAKLISRLRNGVISPTAAPKAAPTVGVSRSVRSPPPSSLTANSTSEPRNRSQTTTTPSGPPLAPTEEPRARTASVSLHHTVSFSSFHPSPTSTVSTNAFPSASPSASPRLMPSKSVVGLSDHDRSDSPPLRIRSKVSAMVKSASDNPPPSPTSVLSSPPLQPSSRSINTRARAPSISSSMSLQSRPVTSPPPQFYPITTATPVANPHRFARASPPAKHHAYQPFGQNPGVSPAASDESPSSKPRVARVANINGVAKVDPASIPLPPLSPPTSAVSFSSRSSVSRSSASVSYLGGATPSDSQPTSTSTNGSSRLSPATQHGGFGGSGGNLEQLKSTLDSLMEYTAGLPSTDESGGDSAHDRDTDGEMEQAERKVKAAAKSDRKIADLEITNRSLLAINATLEATKHRQAKEIRELRRKLRESRLILPPPAYRAVKSSLGPAEMADDEEDGSDASDADEAEPGVGDEIYQRVKLILDNLLKSGQQALEKQVKDFPEGNKSTTKVLTAEEVRDWHGELGSQNGYNAERDENDLASERSTPDVDDDIPTDADTSFDYGGNDSMLSEEEVEALTIPPSSPPPPILITQPT
ncbi:unnamed protein product [Cyclocybe aegerita]|uniref:Uncharacterized protein n=1 Tax=Cyclocybe aegerita TaxID=1973307 RepID=A0A8S0WC94_CYCAE|nr:unnamed protein product [Cyclocybe aegerita]